MTLTHLIIYGLATWRVASLLVEESGPFDIFKKIRELTGITHDEDDLPLMIPDRFFAQLFSCVWCTSVWVAVAYTLVSLWKHGIYTALPFALSAVAVLLQDYLNK